MAAQKGSAFLLKDNSTGSPVTLGGMRSTSMTINGEMVDITDKDSFIVPLFVRVPNGEIQIISSKKTILSNFVEGSALVYLGRPIDVEESKTKGQAPILTEE